MGGPQQTFQRSHNISSCFFYNQLWMNVEVIHARMVQPVQIAITLSFVIVWLDIQDSSVKQVRQQAVDNQEGGWSFTFSHLLVRERPFDIYGGGGQKITRKANFFPRHSGEANFLFQNHHIRHDFL